MFCFANQPKSRMFLAGWLMLSVGMLFGAPGDNVKDPIAGKIRITAGASSWDHVDDDTDSVPIELYDVVDNDYVGGATVDGYDSANWTATKGVCVPTTAAVSIVWKATGGVGGTGTATITASLYDKVDNAEADDAANLTLTVTCTGWELTAISPTTIDVLYKGQGKKQTFTATTTPASPPADVAAKISWTANGGTMNPTTGLTSEWTQDASYVSAAVDDVMIACAVGSGPKKEAKTTVVNIDKLQYQEPGSSSWTDVGATLYIVTGTSVTFKATKTPGSGGVALRQAGLGWDRRRDRNGRNQDREFHHALRERHRLQDGDGRVRRYQNRQQRGLRL